MKYCDQCGTKNSANAKFCTHCGTAFDPKLRKKKTIAKVEVEEDEFEEDDEDQGYLEEFNFKPEIYIEGGVRRTKQGKPVYLTGRDLINQGPPTEADRIRRQPTRKWSSAQDVLSSMTARSNQDFGSDAESDI